MDPVGKEPKADARVRVLEAATRIFLRHGFAQARVDMIAAAARISKLSIYELFPSKAALFEAAVRNACDADFFSASSIADEADIRVALRHIGEQVFERFLGPVQFGLTRANIVAATEFPVLASEIHDHQTRTSQGIADHLQLWIDRGVLARQDAMRAAVRFAGLCVEGSRYFLGAAIPGQKERAAIVADAVELFLYGYRALPTGRRVRSPARPLEPPSLARGTALRLPAAKLDRIMVIAGEEFLARGLRGANLDRIVTAVPVAKTTLYRQFGDKRGLFRHVVEHRAWSLGGAAYRIDGLPELEREIAILARQALDGHCTVESVRLHRLLIAEADMLAGQARAFHEMRVQRLGEALAVSLARHHQPAAGEQAIRFFHLLATFALRYLTNRLPDEAQRMQDSAEAARLFLHGALRRPSAR